MKAYYPNTLKIVKDFNRTEEALRSRAWTTDSTDFTTYGFTRVPSVAMLKSRKNLDKCAWDYKFTSSSFGPDGKQHAPIATLTSKTGITWELHFEDTSEQYLWKLEFFKTELVLPKLQK